MFGKDEFLTGDVKQKTARYDGEALSNSSPKCGRTEIAREAQRAGERTPQIQCGGRALGQGRGVGRSGGLCLVLVCKL